MLLSAQIPFRQSRLQSVFLNAEALRFPALLSYYGRSDFRRSALRPVFEHEHRACPGRKFTAFLNSGSCHSVSNHVMHTSGIFCCQQLPSSLDAGLDLGLFFSDRLCSRAWIFCSRLRASTARSPDVHPTESSSLWGPHGPLHYGLAFRFQLLSTVGLSPPQFLSTTGWLTSAWRGLAPHYAVTFAVAPWRS
jgi:hypothetical protein